MLNHWLKQNMKKKVLTGFQHMLQQGFGLPHCFDATEFIGVLFRSRMHVEMTCIVLMN